MSKTTRSRYHNILLGFVRVVYSKLGPTQHLTSAGVVDFYTFLIARQQTYLCFSVRAAIDFVADLIGASLLDPGSAERWCVKAIQAFYEDTKQHRVRNAATRDVLQKLAAAPVARLPRTDLWRFRTLLFVLYRFLLRISEALRLRWKDVRFEKDFVKLHIFRKKTKKVREWIPCVRRSRVAILLKFLKRQDRRNGAGRAEDHIFAAKGKVWSTAFVNDCIRSATTATKLEGHYSSHSFRIGCATDLVIAGVPLQAVMSLGGWKSSAVDSYIRLLSITTRYRLDHALRLA